MVHCISSLSRRERGPAPQGLLRRRVSNAVADAPILPSNPPFIPFFTPKPRPEGAEFGGILTFERFLDLHAYPMNRFNRIYLVFLLLILLPLVGKAQTPKGPWTLQQCVDYALKNNLQIRQTEINTQTNQLLLTQYKANLLPTLNGSGSHTYNYGRTIDPFTNLPINTEVLSDNASLNAGLVLFSGFQKFNTARQGQYDVLAAYQDGEKMKNDISLNIASAYLQILFSDELLTIAHNQVGISEIQVERTKKLVDAGALARGNLLLLQAQLATDELGEANARNQVDLSYLSLAQLLDLDSAGTFSIVKPQLAVPSESLLTLNASQIYSIALGVQPGVKGAQYRLKSYDMQLRVAKGAAYPRLSLFGSLGTFYSGAVIEEVGTPTFTGTFSPTGDVVGPPYQAVMQPNYNVQTRITPFSNQVSNNFSQSFGLSLSIPIFNGLQTYTSVERAKLQLKNADLNLQIQELQLRKTIQQAYADANAALIKYSATLKSVEATKESFKYTEQKFNVGLLNSLDFNDAKNKLIKAQSDLLQAKYDYIFKVKVLDFYQGKPLTL
jgi:outer membrane protein